VTGSRNPASGHRIGFSEDDLRRSRRFHRPRYVALAVDLALALATLAALTRLGLPIPWWGQALALPVVVDVALALVRLPVAWWRYRHDVRFGLSTQSPGGFAVDAAKGAAVGAALALAALAPLYALVHRFPDGWVWPAAAGAGLLVFVGSFLAPVVLEPVWNRFAPLADDELAARLRELAARAGTPVSEILVADASRRTTRQNAYVSGLGRTRRVVLWDTLLETPADEIAVVLAHELGHRARRHVAILTGVAVAGAAGFVLVLRLLRPQPAPRDTALILLLGLVLELATLPGVSALSRRFERVADRFSLELTGNRAAFQALHRRLALANLSDLDPPRWLYYWLFSHPTAPERLADT